MSILYTLLFLISPDSLLTIFPKIYPRVLLLLLLIVGLGINNLAWVGPRPGADLRLRKVFEAIRGYVPSAAIALLVVLIPYNIDLVFSAPLFLILYRIAFFILLTRFFGVGLAIQFENRQPFESFGRVWTLTAPPRWAQLFGRIIVSYLTALIIALPLWIEGVIVNIIRYQIVGSVKLHPLTALDRYIISVLAAPFIAIFASWFNYIFVEIYIDLRVRRGEWTTPFESEPTTEPVLSQV